MPTDTSIYRFWEIVNEDHGKWTASVIFRGAAGHSSLPLRRCWLQIAPPQTAVQTHPWWHKRKNILQAVPCTVNKHRHKHVENKKVKQLSSYFANSLVHVEEDVSTAVTIPPDSCLLCAWNIQVVVGQPCLLFHVVHITDVVSYGKGTQVRIGINIKQPFAQMTYWRYECVDDWNRQDYSLQPDSGCLKGKQYKKRIGGKCQIYQRLLPEEELLPMWLTTLMSLKELAKSPLYRLEEL